METKAFSKESLPPFMNNGVGMFGAFEESSDKQKGIRNDGVMETEEQIGGYKEE